MSSIVNAQKRESFSNQPTRREATRTTNEEEEGMNVKVVAAIAMMASAGDLPAFVDSGGDKSKLPHWLRGSNGGGKTKNGRYYTKRIKQRRKKAGR